MILAMYRYGRRDQLAAKAVDWILRHVASDRYRKMTEGAIRYGLLAAARDEIPPWEGK